MAQPTFEQAFALHQAGRLPEAERAYRKILAAEPNHARALHLLGVLAHQAGRNEVAVSLIRQALALKLDRPEVWSNLGIAQGDLGQLDDAIACFRKAIDLNPKFPEAHNNLGNALKSRGLLDEAAAQFRQAIALKPNYAEAYYNLGHVLRDKSQADLAIGAYEKAQALQPKNPRILLDLGKALLKQDRWDDAVVCFRQALKLGPDQPDVLNELGRALAKGGPERLAEVITCFRRAIALKPDFAEAHSNLGNALISDRRWDEAFESIQKSRAIAPDLSESHRTPGTLAPLCICNGVVRSGSTWSFNVCRELYREADPSRKDEVISTYLNITPLEEFVTRQWPKSTGPTVVKAHFPGVAAIRAMIAGDARAVVTFRDPRDCVASDLIYTDFPFEDSIKRVSDTLAPLRFYKSIPNCLLVRYEDMMADRPREIRRIADHLGLTVDEAVIRRIDEKTNMESSEKICANLKDKPLDQILELDAHRVDPATQLRDNHMHGGTIGRWKHELSAEQIARLNERFGRWLLELGYETPIANGSASAH